MIADFPAIVYNRRMDNTETRGAFAERLEKIERVLARFLPADADAEWIRASFGDVDGCVGKAHTAGLTAPTRSLLELGGKRWRPLLLVLCAEAVGGSEGEARGLSLTPLVEFAHTASLIHDDIEDGADERRGKPAAHLAFGTDVAINAASWLYFQAEACISGAPVQDAQRLALHSLYAEELRRLHLGQAMDILWHRNEGLFPSIEEYTAMVRNKTGTLARLAVRAGVLAGGGPEEISVAAGRAAQDVGTGFQIIDDVLNLTTGNPGKKRGDDIVEGKKSLPVLLHLKRRPGDSERLADLFRRAKEGGICDESVEEAISLLSESGAVEEARAEGNRLIDGNGAELSRILGGQGAAAEIGRLFGALKK